jgi:hypothetical protein
VKEKEGCKCKFRDMEAMGCPVNGDRESRLDWIYKL